MKSLREMNTLFKAILKFPHLFLYAGDFNRCHANWGYDNNSPDGEWLAGWQVLYNAKDKLPISTRTAGTLAPIQI